jgi:biopolymer transport protein ExbB
MITQKLLSFTLLGADWVLWLLIALSVLSIAIMIERSIFFLSHRLGNAAEVLQLIGRGDVDGAKKAVEGKTGLEASVLLEGLRVLPKGADAAEEAMAATATAERMAYERGLAFLGTLGNNAPFIGLFGTVLGIIRAFHDLAESPIAKAAGAQTVMSGISEALVATAIGLFVALPAVVAFNLFQRWLKSIASNATAIAHALVGQLRAQKAA